MNRFERFSLILVAIGSALVWLLPSFTFLASFPEWVTSRFYLYVCTPALILGAVCFNRYGGFAKSKGVLLCGLVMCVGILWTDSSEQGRGMLLAAGYLSTLPIAALIRKQNYLRPFLTTFALTTAITMLYGLTQPAAMGRWGEILDASGTHITNANVVGTQAAIAIAAALMSFPQRRMPRIVFVVALAALSIACLMTQSRTGILALAGVALVVVFMRLRHKPALLFTAGFFTIAVSISLVAADAAFGKGSIIQSALNRVVLDDEQTTGSLGDRTQIWRFAQGQFLEGTNWITGVGTGGVDKELGKFYEFSGRSCGRDRIWRLYPHNSLVQNGLAFGLLGLVLTVFLGFQIVRNAYLLDSATRNWQRTAYVVLVGMIGTALVVQREVYWIAAGSALWAMVSSDKPPLPRRAVPRAASRAFNSLPPLGNFHARAHID